MKYRSHQSYPRLYTIRRVLGAALLCAVLATCGGGGGGGGSDNGGGGGGGSLFLPELLAQSIIESIVQNFIGGCTVCPQAPVMDGVDNVAGVDIEYDVRLEFFNANGVELDGQACGTSLFVYLQYDNLVDGTGDAIDPQGDRTHLENVVGACGLIPPGIHPYVFTATQTTIELSFAAALTALESRLTFIP